MVRPLDQMIRVYPSRDEAFPHSSQVGAVVVEFRSTYFAGQMQIFAALDPDVAANLEALPRLEKLGCRIDMPSGVSVPVAADALAHAPPSELLKLVIKGGWDHVDLLLDQATGRGLFSGLTLGEMAMSTPPQGWSEGRLALYPWEMPGWKMPGAAAGGSWAPPSVTKKPGHGRYVVAFEGAVAKPLASPPTGEARPVGPAVETQPAAPSTQPETSGAAGTPPGSADLAATLLAAKAAGGEAEQAADTLLAANHDGTAAAFAAAAAAYLARKAEGGVAPASQLKSAIVAAARGYPDPLKAAVIALLPHIPSGA